MAEPENTEKKESTSLVDLAVDVIRVGVKHLSKYVNSDELKEDLNAAGERQAAKKAQKKQQKKIESKQ